MNPVMEVDQYPVPKAEDLLAILAGGQKFTKLDLSHAYQQVVLSEESRQYVTINTHKGLYRYNRLPFGIASAPAIFQQTMEKILHGIPGVTVYIDDILITGRTDEEHLRTLDLVLERLDQYDLHLKRVKCSFMQPSVRYLGYLIDKDGLHTTPEKVSSAPDTHSYKRTTAPFLFGSRELLWKIYPEPVDHCPTTQPSVVPEHCLGVDNRLPDSLRQAEGEAGFL